MKNLRYVVVDVFSDSPLSGNPLAVFTDARGLGSETMQALARELNLSETTFVLPAERGGSARVRIFTPRAEIPFAGHPTLGTALVLGGPVAVDTLTLELGVGPVPVRLEREAGRVVAGWFSRPAPSSRPFTATAQLLAALGVGRAVSPMVVYDNGVQHVIVHLSNEGEVDALSPNSAEIARLHEGTVVVVAAQGEEATVRVFAPAFGVIEDPATGSAAAPIFCHLIAHAGLDPAAMLTIRQGAQLQRPSTLRVRQLKATTQAKDSTIEVGGAGIVVARGEFRLP